MSRIALVLVALAAALAGAPGARAASWLDPGENTYVPVAGGVIEHTVYEYELTRDGTTYLAGNRLERWVASDRSRTVTYHPNGTLTSEDTVVGAEWRHFTAESNVLRVSRVRFPGRPLMPNQATYAAILREQVQAGWLKVAERTTYAGRPALVLVDGPKDPDRGFNSERLTVDASSWVELEGLRWATGFGEDGSRSETLSRRRLVVDEDLPRDAAGGKLAMSPHPTAEIRGGDAAKRAKKARKARRARRAAR